MLNLPELMKKYSFFIDFTGLHYHYNISIGFDCDKALPFFLLLCPQSKSLIGFGWGGPFHVSSEEWEKPSPLVFGVRKGQVNLNGKHKKCRIHRHMISLPPSWFVLEPRRHSTSCCFCLIEEMS